MTQPHFETQAKQLDHLDDATLAALLDHLGENIASRGDHDQLLGVLMLNASRRIATLTEATR